MSRIKPQQNPEYLKILARSSVSAGIRDALVEVVFAKAAVKTIETFAFEVADQIVANSVVTRIRFALINLYLATRTWEGRDKRDRGNEAGEANKRNCGDEKRSD